MNEQNEQYSFWGNVFHFIAFSIALAIYQVFPQAIFWFLFIFLIYAYICIIVSYSKNLRIIYVLSITVVIIVVDILSMYFPNIIKFPETFNNTAELIITSVLFSMIIYFLISFIFHFYVKLHWIHLVTVTFVISLYKIILQFKDFFLNMEHNFITFIAFLLGTVGIIGLSLFLGYLLGNAFNGRMGLWGNGGNGDKP